MVLGWGYGDEDGGDGILRIIVWLMGKQGAGTRLGKTKIVQARL